jgi:hypothetical protein
MHCPDCWLGRYDIPLLQWKNFTYWSGGRLRQLEAVKFSALSVTHWLCLILYFFSIAFVMSAAIIVCILRIYSLVNTSSLLTTYRKVVSVLRHWPSVARLSCFVSLVRTTGIRKLCATFAKLNLRLVYMGSKVIMYVGTPLHSSLLCSFLHLTHPKHAQVFHRPQRAMHGKRL